MVSKQVLASQIAIHVRERGNVYKDWYIGIAADPESALFTDHTVKEDGDEWIFNACATASDAREVAECFIKDDMKGDIASNDPSAVWEYAYKISSTTKQ